jgi:hypothetical protein
VQERFPRLFHSRFLCYSSPRFLFRIIFLSLSHVFHPDPNTHSSLAGPSPLARMPAHLNNTSEGAFISFVRCGSGNWETEQRQDERWNGEWETREEAGLCIRAYGGLAFLLVVVSSALGGTGSASFTREGDSERGRVAGLPLLTCPDLPSRWRLIEPVLLVPGGASSDGCLSFFRVWESYNEEQDRAARGSSSSTCATSISGPRAYPCPRWSL